jgi:uncharacterized protein
MNPDGSFAAFAGRKYLNLETLRKNGQPVRTPVWFAADDSAPDEASRPLFVYTIGASGKVKRIRNNPSVRIAPCTARGGLLGEWVRARARIESGAEAERGMRLLNRKYFPWRQLLGFAASFSRRERVVFTLWPE